MKRSEFPLPLSLSQALALVLVLTLAAAPLVAQPTERAIQAREEIPEDLLLDVSIQVFDPNLPPGLEDWEIREKDIFPDVRRAEGAYVAVKLMQVLQSTGQWGAVRVVPRGTETADLRVHGTIEESNGSKLVVRIEAHDSSGERWLSEKYKQDADPGAYQDASQVATLRDDPFRGLYNEIANDLLAEREKLDPEELRDLRQISEMLFAADLAPDAFDGYVDTDRKGRYELLRLPAEGDPMLERVRDVRDRDYLFIDTLTDHYANFYARMDPAYDNWRKFAYQEEEARREIRRKARKRKILGALGILAGVLATPDSRIEAAASDAAIIGGVVALQSGFAKGKEAQIHEEALKELAASFDAEVDPLLIEVEGQTLRLTGSVETQYKTWRELLRTLFLEETGFPVDPDTGEPVTAAATP